MRMNNNQIKTINEATLEELLVIHYIFGIKFEINDGVILDHARD